MLLDQDYESCTQIAEQFEATLWAVHKNYDYSDPFIFKHDYFVQMSFKLVTSKFISRTICQVC